jgi:hypothetical protein
LTATAWLKEAVGVDGQQSLMSPTSLQFFYERYELGDYEAIK